MDDQVEISFLDVGNGKRHMSVTPSVKSEDTPISCFTPDAVTAVVETPESSVTSDFLQCIDPRLLEISDAMQQCTQTTDILPQSVLLTEAVPRMAQCPVCRTEIDADFLEQYTNGETRVKLRVPMAFCMAHKKNSAEDEWVSRNYPAIRWDSLEERLFQFHSSIHDIVDSNTPSFYRDSLTAAFNMDTGAVSRQRHLHSTGYYRPQGSELL